MTTNTNTSSKVKKVAGIFAVVAAMIFVMFLTFWPALTQSKSADAAHTTLEVPALDAGVTEQPAAVTTGSGLVETEGLLVTEEPNPSAVIK